jgi:uncharacterized protein (UPF0335 family)
MKMHCSSIVGEKYDFIRDIERLEREVAELKEQARQLEINKSWDFENAKDWRDTGEMGG